MEGKFAKIQHDFTCAGLDLNTPTDAQEQAKHYPILVNVRQVVRGTLRSRPGLNTFQTAVASNTPWHSVRRLNDKFAGEYTYVSGMGAVGAGILATGKTAGTATSRDTGYSGNPLSLLPFRPEQTSNEWMAVADANKMRKVKYDGTVRSLGVAAPKNPPTVELDYQVAPGRAVIDAGTNYDTSGVAVEWEAAPANGNITRVNTTQATDVRIAGYNILLGTAGWYTLPLNSLENITPSTLLTSGGGVTAIVEEVHPGTPASITCSVDRVINEAGILTNAQNWVTIVPTVALKEIALHSLIEITHGGTPYTASVVELFEGEDGKIAFRIYLSGAEAASPGDALRVLPSVYAYMSAQTAAATTWTATGTKWLTLPASTSSNLVRGTFANQLNLNLSSYATGGRKVNEELDEMCISLFVSDPTRISEIKIQADIDNGGFNENYLTRSVRPDDLIPVLNNTVTATDNRTVEIRRKLQDRTILDGHRDDLRDARSGRRDTLDDAVGRINNLPGGPGQRGNTNPDDPGGSGSQTPAGGNQWFTIRIKMSDWERVGEDKHVGLFNVIALRFVVTTTAAGTVDFGFDDWAIIGGYEPDVSSGSPYEYSYRYRDSTTGARSNWSPISRSLVWPHRYQVLVDPLDSVETGVDRIDIRRRGGFVNDWRIIATIPNGSSALFQDTYSDEHALGVGAADAALEGNVNAQPFTLAAGSKVITATTVAGIMVHHAGAGFNLAWAQGTPLIVNQVPTYIYKVHSTSVLEVYTHCGVSNAAAIVDIPQQFLTSQPLPIIFGTQDGWSFALGDSYNPGRLYFFNPGTLDSTRASFWIDVSDSSEQLMNGCVYNGRVYVWSTEHMYAISQSGDEAIWRSDLVTGGVGMYARWALAVGDLMYWLGKDGIYASDGGSTFSITRRSLLPLFGDEGVAGTDTNTLSAPHMPQNATAAQLAAMRLCYAHDKNLYFDYKDAAGNRRTLVMDRSSGGEKDWGWYYDIYANGAVFHYADEGEGVRSVLVGCANATTAQLYTLGGSTKTDAGTSINCQVRTFAAHGGDQRTHKLIGDGTIDVDPANATITPTFWFDNFTTSIAASTITGAARTTPPTIADFNTGAGVYALNIALDLAWTISADNMAPVLYGWGFSAMGRPEQTIKRATDYSDLGHWGPKELKGVSIECDTGGAAKTVLIEYTKEDGTVATISKTVNTGQKDIEHLTFDPVICYEARLRPTDTNRWREYEVVKWHFEPLTDLSGLVGDWHHFNRAVWVQGVEIDGDTNNVAVSTPIQRDFSEVIRTISATHNGRGTKAYSFDPPFIAYMVRTAPAGAFRRMKENWIFQPEAPIGTVWETQEFELGTEWGFSKQLEIEYASAATLTITYIVDGVTVITNTTTATSSGSTETFKKLAVILPAYKGRLGKFRVACATGVRVREKGTMLLRKAWGDQDFTWVPVAGAIHNTSGAEV